MVAKIAAGLAGAVVGIAFAVLSATIIMAARIPGMQASRSPVVLTLATASLAILGTVVGVKYEQLATRRLTTGPEADYEDRSTPS